MSHNKKTLQWLHPNQLVHNSLFWMSMWFLTIGLWIGTMIK